MWDLNLEEDKDELQWSHIRDRPACLFESPPSDEFSSLVRTRSSCERGQDEMRITNSSSRESLQHTDEGCGSSCSKFGEGWW